MRTGNAIHLTRASWCALGLVVVALGVAIVRLLQVPAEPSFGGTPLTQHLRSVPPPDGFSAAQKQKQALLQMAPDCFPYMLVMMRATDSRLRQRLVAFLAKQKLFTFRTAPRPSYQTRWEAARGIALLGPDAHPAVPGLTRLLGDPDTAGQAAFALAFIGTADARQALEAALCNRRTVIRQTVSAPLDILQSRGATLVPALIERLADPDDWVRENAVRALGAIRSSPEMTIPALATALRDRSSNVRRTVAQALKGFGEAARPAEAALRAALAANDPTDRDAMRQALRVLGITEGPASPATSAEFRSRESSSSTSDKLFAP